MKIGLGIDSPETGCAQKKSARQTHREWAGAGALRIGMAVLGSGGQRAGGLAENIIDGFAQGWEHSDGGQRKEYKQERILNQILAFVTLQEFL